MTDFEKYKCIQIYATEQFGKYENFANKVSSWGKTIHDAMFHWHLKFFECHSEADCMQLVDSYKGSK